VCRWDFCLRLFFSGAPGPSGGRSRPDRVWLLPVSGSVPSLAAMSIRMRNLQPPALTLTRAILYFGSIVIVVGFALAALRWEIALALVILFTAVYIPVIYGEERFLAAFADSREQNLPRVAFTIRGVHALRW